MIISRTPFRISFFGGGTDYPGWFQQHGGAVLVTTINKYCYITARYLPPFFEHRSRIVYSKTELVNGIEQIEHPAVRECLRHLGIRRGVEIHHDGDLPARSGLGSSSAFAVGLLHSLHALQGRIPSKEQLARESIRLEQELLRETVGCQDQLAAAYGGLNRVTFKPGGDFVVTPMTLPRERLEALCDHLMLFYTGIRREASQVAGSYVEQLPDRAAELRRMTEMVGEAVAILNERRPLAEFGRLLDEGWSLKRRLGARISNPQVEGWYQAARAAGAVRDDNPVMFIEHRMLHFQKGYVPEEPYTVPFGKARVLTEGSDITVVGVSYMAVEAMRAERCLAAAGIRAEVIDPVSLAPLDSEAVVASVRKTRRLLVVDNAWTHCGVSAEIVSRVVEALQDEGPIRVARMGFAPVTCPTSKPLEHAFYRDARRIACHAHAMVTGEREGWTPDEALIEQPVAFRGPF